MLHRIGFAAVLAICGLFGGVALVAFAQSMSAPAAPSGATAGAQVVASSTNLQSFLWMLDGGGRTITFCFSTASPETGPQYDFKCRSRNVSDALAP
jgi:hypothetical protein